MVALNMIVIWLVALVILSLTLAYGVVSVSLCRKLWFWLDERLYHE